MSALSNFSFRDNQAPPFDLEPIGLHLFQLVYKRVWSETLSFIHLKMMNKITVILVSLLILASGYKVRPSAKNAVQDAHDQLAKHIRCWEEVDDDDQSKGYTLSEPIYELCSFMPDPKDYNKFYVNGVDMESDVYTNFLAMYANALEGYAVLNVCIQEVSYKNCVRLDNHNHYRPSNFTLPNTRLKSVSAVSANGTDAISQ